MDYEDIIFEEESHTYTLAGKQYDSVTQIMRTSGLGPDFSSVNKDILAHAQERGKRVHKAIHFLNEGDLDMNSVDRSIRGYVEGYRLFMQECTIKIIAAEKKIVNTRMGFAGTADIYCFLNGYRAVIDLKTSQSMTKSMGIQTSAYQALWNLSHPNKPVILRYGLRLDKNGYYKLFPHVDPDDYIAFVDAINYSESFKKMTPWKEKYG